LTITAGAGGRASAKTYIGLFVITLTTLMYEIALTRIFSVTMWYHFAFVAISVALFGMTIGALLVYLLPHRFRDADVKRHLWRSSLFFSVSLAVCFVTQLAVPFSPHGTLVGLWSILVTCVVISIPFVFSGIVVCLALTRFPARVNRLYAADLIGAAIGCVLLVVLLSRLDGPSSVIVVGALAGLGALAFASDAGSRRGVRVAAVVVVLLGGFGALNGYLHSRGNPFLRIIWAKEAPDVKHKYEKWNAFSRVTVDGFENVPQPPAGYGYSTKLPGDIRVNQLGMVIDSTAGTMLTRYTGNPAETDFLRYDITNLAHWAKPHGDVLVIGVGGGRDILSALEFDQKSVTGVEINGNILNVTNGVYGDFTGHLDRNPRVKFVNDEARSYLARTDRKYDIIQISLIDTWAATSAGAYALSENSLYTTDAWKIFFDRLKPGGVLSVSRWYELSYRQKPLETYRTAALAAQTLKERGVANPRDHILIYHGPEYSVGLNNVNTATILVSPQPFSPATSATIAREAQRLEFTPVLTRQEAIDPHFAALASPGGPGRAVNDFPEDISPPSDNRPFFFQMANIDTFLRGGGFRDDFATRPVLVLGMLALTVLGLAIGCIVVPLLLTTKRTAHRGMRPYYIYFAGIGLGFLLIEVSQLQRLSIFLGHPIYALTVVLFSVLFFSGLGSMVTERVIRADRPTSMVAPLVVLLAAVAAFGILTPAVVHSMDNATTPVRIATAIGLLAPLSFLMGMPFAIGMRAAASRPNAPTAFLWGINGATSVCASVFGMVIALFFGIAAAFWCGFVAYAIATASIAVIARSQPGRRVVPDEAVAEPAEPARVGAVGAQA
jgi:SAM-dependent methyltransferase